MSRAKIQGDPIQIVKKMVIAVQDENHIQLLRLVFVIRSFKLILIYVIASSSVN